jgi:hypothetical protein
VQHRRYSVGREYRNVGGDMGKIALLLFTAVTVGIAAPARADALLRETGHSVLGCFEYQQRPDDPAWPEFAARTLVDEQNFTQTCNWLVCKEAAR